MSAKSDSLHSKPSLGFIFACIVVLLIAQRSWRYIDIFGVLRQANQIHPGVCSVLEGNYLGSEDITLGPNGSVIASTGGLTTIQKTKPHLYQGDKLLRITGKTVETFELNDFNHTLIPHGIDLKEIDDDHWLVFVVNHRSDQDYVEMFDWFLSKGLTLYHYQSVGMNELGVWGHINDVSVVSRHSFYATNDKFWNSPVGRIGHFLGIPWCKLVFWDSGRASTVSRGYIEPNGVALSPDSEKLFFTDTMRNMFYEFKRDKIDGSLKLLSSLKVPTGMDNIEMVSENEVLIGCHVRLHDLFPYFRDIEVLRSPSHVIRVHRTNKESSWKYQDLFMDDGFLVSGSSAAVHADSKLYVGTVTDKIAVCESPV